jgi:protein FAM50
VATARLSFADDDAEAEGDEEDAEEENEKEKEAAADAGGAAGGAAGGGAAGDAAGAPDAAADVSAKRAKFGSVGKNPSVCTTFLPDREREREERAERERLKEAWSSEQAALKAQPLEITYSYWDGAGHRRSVVVRKGDTIGAFLRAVRDALAPEFRELKAASPDQMLYIKEDLIIPHSFTFHELIVSKARGKSGPLFHFDVHDDVRASGNAQVEKDEAHAGKVLERHWYDKNKHIFPASRWEVFDPAKDYGSYSIHGGEIN